MKQYYVAFHLLSKFTNARFFKILRGCDKDLRYAWEKAGQSELVAWGMESDIAECFVREKTKIDPEQEWLNLQKKQVHVVLKEESEYPTLLKEIADPPPLLYIRGNPENLRHICLGIVGTRLMSSYGKQVIQHLLPELVGARLTIVSGLAMGVDAYTHRTTLDLNGHTVSVLGSGIDQIFPTNNRRLAEEIAEKDGNLISEFPPNMKPTPYSFPIRNRIISGLSRGVVIVEAKEKSGSLITAQLALEQNREVFAVPGNLFSPNSQGVHNLIRSGEASLITAGSDILRELGIEPNTALVQDTKPILRFETNEQETVYLALGSEAQEADQVIRKSKLDAARVNAILTVLEIRRLARNLGGGRWVRG